MTNLNQQKKLFLAIVTCSLGSSICFAPNAKSNKKAAKSSELTKYIPLGIIGSIIAGLGIFLKFSSTNENKVARIYQSNLIKNEITELLEHLEEESVNNPKADFLKITEKLKTRHKDKKNDLLKIEANVKSISEEALAYDKLTSSQRNIFSEQISKIKQALDYLNLTPSEQNRHFELAVKKAIIESYKIDNHGDLRDLIIRALFEILYNSKHNFDLAKKSDLIEEGICLLTNELKEDSPNFQQMRKAVSSIIDARNKGVIFRSEGKKLVGNFNQSALEKLSSRLEGK